MGYARSGPEPERGSGPLWWCRVGSPLREPMQVPAPISPVLSSQRTYCVPDALEQAPPGVADAVAVASPAS